MVSGAPLWLSTDLCDNIVNSYSLKPYNNTTLSPAAAPQFQVTGATTDPGFTTLGGGSLHINIRQRYSTEHVE